MRRSKGSKISTTEFWVYLTVLCLLLFSDRVARGQTLADYKFYELSQDVTSISSSITPGSTPVFSLPSKFL